VIEGRVEDCDDKEPWDNEADHETTNMTPAFDATTIGEGCEEGGGEDDGMEAEHCYSQNTRIEDEIDEGMTLGEGIVAYDLERVGVLIMTVDPHGNFLGGLRCVRTLPEACIWLLFHLVTSW